MGQENVDLIRGAYEAFNRGDIDGVLAIMDSEVEWHEPGGGNAPAGTFRGPQSIAEGVFARVPDQFEDFQVETDQFVDAGEHVAVIGRFRGKSKAGTQLDAPYVHVATVRGGKQVEFRNYVASEPWSAAWS